MTPPTAEVASAPLGEATETQRETVVAIRNALTLGGSLIAAWSVALLVRIALPRFLGPATFGTLNFADTFAATFFVVLGLGLDTYIRKEIPVRPEHASDFFGGVILVRLAMTGAILVAMTAVMRAAHRSPEVELVVFVFGAAQLLVMVNGNLAALLHAARTVGGLAVVNVGAKIVWGLGVLGALVLHLDLVWMALALLGSEGIRSVALGRLAQRHLHLRLRIDAGAVRLAVVASLPFYLNAVANTVYARVDVSMLSMLSNDTEVGWYGAASNFAALALLVSPLVGWVLLPLLARAAKRSPAELYELLRRATRVVLLLILPVALFLHLGADVWIRTVFGEPFAPAIPALRLLAPMFVFTYLAMIEASGLILLGKAWTVTAISLGGLALNPALNLLLVPRTARLWGAGGAGTGAAIALLATEATVTCALTAVVGRNAFDRSSLSAIGKALFACAVVVGLDHALGPLGPARLAADVLAYLALMLALGVVRADQIVPLARFVLHHGRSHATSP